MANYLKTGSSGSKVRELQELLNKQGYNLAVDGVYGSATQNAVRKYQRANGLGVDGIVGDETWGSLTKGGGNTAVDGSTTAAPPSATTPLGTTYNPEETTGNKADLNAVEGMGPTFGQSQAYKDAYAALQQHQAQQPGAYVSPFADRLNALYEKVMSRPGFQYDFNADPIYQHYSDQYALNAKRAMQDTMANAAALTGGYGNSYAQMAGQQEYARTMQGLNDVIPTLYNDAWNRYQQEGQDMVDQLQLTQGMDEAAYGRHRDALNDYYTRLNYLYGAAEDAYNKDYALYQDALSKWQADRDYYYGKTQDDLAQENYEAAQAGKSSGGGSGSKSSGGTETKKDKEKEKTETYSIGTLRSALLQLYKTKGPNAALAELERMKEKYNLPANIVSALTPVANGNMGGGTVGGTSVSSLRNTLLQTYKTKGSKTALAELEQMKKRYRFSSDDLESLTLAASQGK